MKIILVTSVLIILYCINGSSDTYMCLSQFYTIIYCRLIYVIYLDLIFPGANFLHNGKWKLVGVSGTFELSGVNCVVTWYFRLPFGIFCVWPCFIQTSPKTFMRNSAAQKTKVARFFLPLPLEYCGRNHSANSPSKRLPLIACAMVLISRGSAHTGTFLI